MSRPKIGKGILPHNLLLSLHYIFLTLPSLSPSLFSRLQGSPCPISHILPSFRAVDCSPLIGIITLMLFPQTLHLHLERYPHKENQMNIICIQLDYNIQPLNSIWTKRVFKMAPSLSIRTSCSRFSFSNAVSFPSTLSFLTSIHVIISMLSFIDGMEHVPWTTYRTISTFKLAFKASS